MMDLSRERKGRLRQLIRCHQIVERLASRRINYNANLLAGELGFTTKTIYRDLRALREAGVFIEYDPHRKRYRLESHSLTRAYLETTGDTVLPGWARPGRTLLEPDRGQPFPGPVPTLADGPRGRRADPRHPAAPRVEVRGMKALVIAPVAQWEPLRDRLREHGIQATHFFNAKTALDLALACVSEVDLIVVDPEQVSESLSRQIRALKEESHVRVIPGDLLGRHVQDVA
ncbi:MAG: HTH domain-containing protein [Candidatus Methylomirabilales bacterium]